MSCKTRVIMFFFLTLIIWYDTLSLQYRLRFYLKVLSHTWMFTGRNVHSNHALLLLLQVLFLMYHYFNAKEIYNAIRVFIAAYVWMTGFGNFSYYYVRKDFSLPRFAQVLLLTSFSVSTISVYPFRTRGFHLWYLSSQTVIPSWPKYYWLIMSIVRVDFFSFVLLYSGKRILPHKKILLK